ncbi:MAG TPA: hypothetical protein VMR43_10655 [Variovorax sp.]|nr:hypothetical protein [Variovorax sp.]
MSATLNQLLMAGEYVCAVRYPHEFSLLSDPVEAAAAQAFLDQMDMRLARLGDEGAFFMAPNFISAKDQAQIKTDLLNFRDVYGPAVLLLEYIRTSLSGTATLMPGDLITVHELEEAVNQSTMIEAQLRTLTAITYKAATRNSNRENLQRVMEHLAKDGYVTLASKERSSYYVTGKIEQLHNVLAYLSELNVLPDQEIDDTSETTDLFGEASSSSQVPEGKTEEAGTAVDHTESRP